ncbi:MAG: restriction endonuclease subunit S [Oscillospiraceae bacterium]|nr:restriction endonuclease subunit S [Oscillospiraceae bacterium]
MSKLDELIRKLCPNGVEYKFLWELTFWDKKFNAVDRTKQPQIINYHYLLAADLFSLEQEFGDVFLLSTGEQTGWTTEEMAGDNLHEGEVVTIPWGKSRAVTDCIKYYKGKFVTADNRIMTSRDTTVLSNKYLYYWIMSMGNVIDTFYRGSGIKHPDMAKVLDMRIPVPPIEVQREIVRILDNFTERTEKLKAELTAELTARKKQYEYYSSKLLTFENVPYYSLESLCDIVDYRGKTPQKVDKGIFLVTAKNIRFGYIDYEKSQEYISEENYEEVMHRGHVQIGDILITTEAPCGNVALADRENIALAQRVIKYRPKDKRISNIYLKYILMGEEFQRKLSAASTGGTVKGIKGSKLHKLTIPVPPLDVQLSIINVLDRFNALCNDISSGLPAEIEARQKQYEFYRDKLLTFKEASA